MQKRENNFSLLLCLKVRPGLGQSLKDLNFRVKYHLTVIAAIRDGIIRPNLSPDYKFCPEDHLLVLGRSEDIRKVIR